MPSKQFDGREINSILNRKSAQHSQHIYIENGVLFKLTTKEELVYVESRDGSYNTNP